MAERKVSIGVHNAHGLINSRLQQALITKQIYDLEQERDKLQMELLQISIEVRKRHIRMVNEIIDLERQQLTDLTRERYMKIYGLMEKINIGCFSPDEHKILQKNREQVQQLLQRIHELKQKFEEIDRSIPEIVNVPVTQVTLHFPTNPSLPKADPAV
jgi:DNA repair exonuclease SbcCD ATPase subunit